jgi:CNT family concentrative nucleoside transporter
MLQSVSCLGIFTFIFIAWLLSTNRHIVNVRLLAATLIFQFAAGFIVFRSTAGQNALLCVNGGLLTLLDAALEGPKFIFGGLSDSAVSAKIGLGYILFFQGLVNIIVMAALISVLYYFGIMNRILKCFAYIFSRITKCSGAESLAATANLFFGTESIFSVRYCLPKLTKSEFCVVMCACMATISVNILGLYVGFLRDVFPNIAGHFVSASLLSVPAAVLCAKLMVPETCKPETLGVDVDPYYEKDNSLVEAVLSGADAGFKTVTGVAVLLIAAVGLLAMFNVLLSAVPPMLGLNVHLTLQGIFAYLFCPFVWLTGVPFQDVYEVAELLGTRIVITEVPAYMHLAELIKSGAIEPRSAVIAAYTLCGFTHIPATAITVGALTALAPERKTDIASLAWQSLIAATLACLITGAAAGLFFQDSSLLLQSTGHL